MLDYCLCRYLLAGIITVPAVVRSVTCAGSAAQVVALDDILRCLFPSCSSRATFPSSPRNSAPRYSDSLSRKAVLGHFPEDSTQVSTGKFLQALTHRFHAEHEESEAPNHLEDHENHRTILLYIWRRLPGSSSLPFS